MAFARLTISGLFLVIAACFFFAPAHAAMVEGVVFSEEGPLKGASVAVYSRLGEIGSATPLAVSLPGERPGQFRLELSPGRYYFVAKGKENGKELFSFHGANPVAVGDERLWLPFAAVDKKPPIRSEPSQDTVTGTVTYHGKPVQDAQVSIYPAADEQFKGLGLLSCTTPGNGSFRFSTAPGSYIIVARKRVNSHGLMPLKKGDLFCYYPENPLQLPSGETTTIEIPCYPRDDVQGFLAKTTTDHRGRNTSSSLSAKTMGSEAATQPVSGRVIDLRGKGVPGVSVQAYRRSSQGPFQMHYLRLMPEGQTFTDSLGSYRIDLPSGEEYFLLAREYSGQAPTKGEWYGLYEGSVDHSISPVKRTDGIDISVSRVMTSADEPAKAEKPTTAKIPANNKLLKFDDLLIEHDTTWTGHIEIAGRVVVRRGVTLNILPGTTVSFVRRDLNSDGIGDAELRVLGRLVAKGTAQNPVRFKSAERVPKPGDWSYILVYAASGIAVLDHCVVEHAFTGLQVHFSQATVTNSFFRKNREGIRFGRGELAIEHNRINDNYYGIRHTRLEGAVRIQYNSISGNDIGIFLVPSNQNIINFGETYESRDSAAPLQPTVRFNSLGGNRRYAYALGERQGYDIDLSGNWWGTVSNSRIAAMIYDRKRDSSLGRVRFAPILRSPMKRESAPKEEAK